MTDWVFEDFDRIVYLLVIFMYFFGVALFTVCAIAMGWLRLKRRKQDRFFDGMLSYYRKLNG